MTGGQVALNLANQEGRAGNRSNEVKRLSPNRPRLNVILADNNEDKAHQERLNLITDKGGHCLWLQEDR
jgi:DNA polymerase-3 subunit epsilon